MPVTVAARRSDWDSVLAGVSAAAEDFAKDRGCRQLRRHLDAADFERLARTGFLRVGAPRSLGGLWEDVERSTRPTCEALRALARGDPSVALVSSMHPAVLSFWLVLKRAPAPYTAAWRKQQRWVAETALDGAWWGTITSEPGSGGDVAKSRALATSAPGAISLRRDGEQEYVVNGQKHFGSGSGVCSYMVTTAIPASEESADWFFLDMRDAIWDGSNGVKLVAEWDGHGMTATQSHAFEFTQFPATRMAWPGNLRVVAGAAGSFVSSVFAAVVVGTVESAFEAARSQVARKRDALRPYELVEWARVETEVWLIRQAYEGMLRAVEAKGSGALLDALHAKTGIAELAESVTGRICRVIGGGSFHRSSHFGAAFEDVRALGFLRPPWGLAFDSILQETWHEVEQQATSNKQQG
jgi:alkylation response protein AidB-like acyl-CoA dehydrogenase